MRRSSILVLLILTGCTEKVAREQQIVVEIADRSFAISEFEHFLERSAQHEQPFLSDDVRSSLLRQFIEEKLLLIAAEDEDVQVNPELIANRVTLIERSATLEQGSQRSRTEDGVKRQLKIQALIDKKVSRNLDIDEAEVRAHFEQNRSLFIQPETVSISQILVENQLEAQEILRLLRIESGNFDELAVKHSIAPDTTGNGLIGSFRRGELPSDFEDVVFSLRIGELSSIIKTNFGFHIFKLNSKTVAKQLPLEAVRDTIHVKLLKDKGADKLASYLKELETMYPVIVHREHLNFAFLEWENPSTFEHPTEYKQ